MVPANGAPRGDGVVRAVLVAFLAGFGCMAAELTAVRLLAPHFGDSAYVWTNVIGVILAALALGAFCGGRWASAAGHGRALPVVLAGGGVGIALAPWIAPMIGGWLVPAGLPLDAAMPTLVRGSFVATALLFTPAMVCIGAVSPLLVAQTVRGGHDVGRASGAVAAAGTLGSLVGTFLATHWLVPTFGCRIAMGSAGALLVGAAVVAGCGRGRGRGRMAMGAAAAGLLLVLLVPRGPLQPAAAGETLLAEVESKSQFLQVLRSEADGVVTTRLRINEGLDSFHSLAIAGSSFTGGAYYDWHALVPFLLGDTALPAFAALSIGDAAGTLRTVYAAVHPTATVDAVDVDGATMALGDAHFAARKAPGERHVLDGRVFLLTSQKRWHCIHVDAYAHQIYVPAHLASRQFFAEAKERLHDGGVIACNVGALHRDDPVLRAIGGTMAEVFGNASVLLVPNTRNALLVAVRGAPIDRTRLQRASEHALAAWVSAADRGHWQQLAVMAARPDAWLEIPAATPLDDDRPVLDALLAKSYIERDDDGKVVVAKGTTAVAGAEGEAYAAAVANDPMAVLGCVARSSGDSAYLRELAGDARWRLRSLRCAAAEYDLALQRADDDGLRARVQDKRARLQQQLATYDLADASASRNGWLQVALAVLLLPLVWLLRRWP